MADAPRPQHEQEIDWNRARAILRTRIASLLDRRDGSLDDLTQEALVDVLRIVRRQGARNLAGLLTVVARSVVAEEIRRRQRERARQGRWEHHLEEIVQLPSASTDDWDEPFRTLWFLLVEYFRGRKASCLTLAERFAELGDWKQVAESQGRSYESTRQQWSRCARMFREELRRNPGRFRDGLGGDV